MKNLVFTLIIVIIYLNSFSQGQQIMYSVHTESGIYDSVGFSYNLSTDTIVTQEKFLYGGAIEIDPYFQNRNGMYSHSNCETPPTHGNQSREVFYRNGILNREIKATYNSSNQIESYIIYYVNASPSPSDSLYKNDYVYDANGRLVQENFYKDYPFILESTQNYYYNGNLLDSISKGIFSGIQEDYHTKYVYNGSQLSGGLYRYFSGANADSFLVTYTYNNSNRIIKDSSYYYPSNTFSITNYIRDSADRILFVTLIQGGIFDTIASYTYNNYGNIIKAQSKGYGTTNYYYKNVSTSISEHIENFEVNIYPNPAHSEATLDYVSALDTPCRIEVLDVSGRLIDFFAEPGFKGQHKVKIPTSHLTKGIYFVNVKNNGHNLFTRKLIK